MKVVANKRDAQGTSASRRLRHAGKVPGVLYGGDGAAQAIEVEHNPLFHALRKEKFHASILDMELDGKSERVLLRDFQMHPYRPLVLHIDFQRVSENQKIHMRQVFGAQRGSQHRRKLQRAGRHAGAVSRQRTRRRRDFRHECGRRERCRH